MARLLRGALALAALITALAPAPAMAKPGPIAALWAVNDGEKVDRDDVTNPNKRGNSVWDGHGITIFAARNEVVAFQVIVEAGREGIGSLSGGLRELRRTGAHPHDARSAIRYTPPAADPTQYVGRDIQVFAASYLTVTKQTNADWIYVPGSPGVPADPLGPTPVQLVPENAKPGKGGFPVAVPANSSQALWFEVYVPKDNRAGTYLGEVTVSADREKRRIPVRLKVYDFALPDRNSLTAMVYYEPDQVERYQGSNLDPAYHRYAHRNRVEFVHAYDIPSATAARDRFAGTDFTVASGYRGPGERVGNTLVPRSFYGPPDDMDTPEEIAANAKPWTDWLAANLPGKQTFLYMPDEPSADQFDYIRSLGEAVHRTGAPLPVFVTRRYDSILDGPNRAIDIWGTVADQYDIAKAGQLRAEGRDMVPYNGQRPNVGAVLIDSPATDPRASMWAAFKHDVRRYFYWHANHWRHNHSVAPGWDRDQNVWAEPITFNNKRGSWANGDGVLVYPGQEVLHPDQDRGVAGPVGTVQFANLRRGLQDHLYLTMAREAGLGHLVDRLVQRMVPKAYSDIGLDQPVSFPQRGDDYERARLVLAEAIQLAKH